jgi:hypothetical protein
MDFGPEEKIYEISTIVASKVEPTHGLFAYLIASVVVVSGIVTTTV